MPSPATPPEPSTPPPRRPPSSAPAPSASSAPAPPQPATGRRRRSPRTVLQVVGLVIGVLLLLWGADALGRYGAETLLAHSIQDATAVPERPEVSVRGAFFLPQVIAGAYQEVDVTTKGITSGPLRLDTVVSTLQDVRVPFHDVLVRDVRSFWVGHSHQDLTLTYADLNAYFQATGRPLTIGPGESGAVKVTGTVSVLNQTVEASADVSLGAEDGVLRVTPERVNTGSGALDRASELLLRQRLNLTVPLGTLPFGHQVTSVEPYAEGLHVIAEGENVVIEP
jgi:LmeA-like phospholipid-binding